MKHDHVIEIIADQTFTNQMGSCKKKWFNQVSLTDPWFLVYTCIFLSPLIVSTKYKNMWYVYLIIELCLCTDEVNDNEVDCYETKCEHAMYPFFFF